MWLAARAFGAPQGAAMAVRAFGWATAAAGYLRALPELIARGRHPLPDAMTGPDLARIGLEKLAVARAARKTVPKESAPALLAGWQTERILKQALTDDSSPLQLTEFQRRGGLLWQSFTGRW